MDTPEFGRGIGAHASCRIYRPATIDFVRRLLAMTKSLAVEWGPRGIRTVAIAAGSFPNAVPHPRAIRGAHLRSSGAEDLLQWTDARWEKLRLARAKR